MRLSMQCDSGGARARSEERALGLIPFSQGTMNHIASQTIFNSEMAEIWCLSAVHFCASER